MTTPSSSVSARKLIVRFLEGNRRHWKLLVIPTVICTLIAGWYAMKPKSWLASQSLVVRDDMIGESFKPGRFESLDSMKTAQETILHISREPSVVRKALEEVGPPKGKKDSWLEGEAGIEVVESTREAISIVAPNGAEFGKTEVIVLQVKAKSRERAGKLATALLNEIESNLRSVRTKRLASMESELAESLKQAEKDYKQFASDLQSLEQEIGQDLPTLLNMISDASSSNDFQIALENIRGTKRTAQAKLDVTEKQLESLKATVDNPEELVATSNELLEAQPALRRLKDGLIDAQLKLSEDMGRFEEAHPKISKARFAISETKLQIRQELQIAIRGLQAQFDVRAKQIARLNEEETQYQQRLQKLTDNRVRYATLVSQSKKRNEEHAKARAEYAEIKSLGQAAQSVDLMTRIEKPFVGAKPLGPGRTSIVGSGIIGGFLIGVGLIMFFSAPATLSIIPPPAGPGENRIRPNDQPITPTPVPQSTPQTSDSGNRKQGMRPVHAVKQLQQNSPAPTPTPAVSNGDDVFRQPETPSNRKKKAEESPVPQLVVSTPSLPTPEAIEAKPVAPSIATLKPADEDVILKIVDDVKLSAQTKSTNSDPGVAKPVSQLPVTEPSKSTESSLPPVTAEPAAQPIKTELDRKRLEGLLKQKAKSPTPEEDPLKTKAGELDAGSAKSNAVPKQAPRKKVKTTPPISEKQSKPSVRDSQPTRSSGPTPTIQLPSEDIPTPQTIDLNTLREELGSAPIEKTQERSLDLNELRRKVQQSEKQPESKPDSAPQSKSESSLHERIKKLTDPSSVVRAPLRKDDDKKEGDSGAQ